MFALLLSGCTWLENLKSQEDETAGWSAQRLYTEAKDAMSSGSWATAVKYFEKLEARYPFGRYAQQAQLEIAYAYYRDNEPASAVAACDRFIKLHPNHPTVDYAYYLKGVVNFYEDQNILTKFAAQDPTERDPRSARDSFAAFKELATRFPDSKYTPDALARMKFLVNALAAHEVHVAQWYIKRGAYVAAANRAAYAVKTYPSAGHRGSAGRDGPVVRPDGHGRSARRRAPGAEDQLSQQPLAQGRRRQVESLVAAVGEIARRARPPLHARPG